MLDYTQREKKFLTVKLADGRLLLLSPPKKSLYTTLSKMEKAIGETDDYEAIFEDVASLTALILSNNKEREVITAAEVEEMMDFDDMFYLVSGYSVFAGEVVANPN